MTAAALRDAANCRRHSGPNWPTIIMLVANAVAWLAVLYACAVQS